MKKITIITALLLTLISCGNESNVNKLKNNTIPEHPVVKTVEMTPLNEEEIKEKREEIRLNNEKIEAEEKLEQKRMLEEKNETKKTIQIDRGILD